MLYPYTSRYRVARVIGTTVSPSLSCPLARADHEGGGGPAARVQEGHNGFVRRRQRAGRRGQTHRRSVRHRRASAAARRVAQRLRHDARVPHARHHDGHRLVHRHRLHKHVCPLQVMLSTICIILYMTLRHGTHTCIS